MSRLPLALLVLGLCLAPAALAQQPGGPPSGAPSGMPAGATLTALVLDDATGEPIPSATLALFQGEGFVTGAASGPDGRITLGGLLPGAYTARISFVGYVRQEREVTLRPGPPLDLGTVRLASDAAQLGEVSVEARRELVEQRADRTVYNVAEQPVTTGGSVLETLQTLPSLEVDTDGRVSLRGNQNVAIHINGRPVPVRGSALSALMRQIPASQVERVEVIPNPSARYEASEMGGIVNIVLKAGTNRGLAGGVTVGGGTAPSGELSGNVSFQRGAVDAYGSYGFRRDAFGLDGFSDRTIGIGGSSPRATVQDLTLGNRSFSHLLNGSLDYTLRPGLSATVNAQGSVRDGAASVSTGTESGLAGGLPSQFELNTTDGDSRGYNGDLALGLRRTFVPQRHTLDAEVRATRNGSRNTDLFLQQAVAAPGGAPVGAGDRTRNAIESTDDEVYAKVDYVRPLRSGRVEAGTRLTWRAFDSAVRFGRMDAGGAFQPVAARTDASLYEEDVQAAYLQGQQAFGKLDVQAGLRAERAGRTFTSRTLGEPFSQSQLDFFPSAFAAYNLGPGTLVKASYSRRINRPRAQQLNPAPQFSDPLNLQRGNPTLRPEFTDSYELTLQALYFATVTPFYRRSTDVIRPRVTVDPVSGISTFGPTNFATDESYGADVTLLGQFGGQRLRGLVSGSVFRSVTEAGTAESGLASDAIGWSARTGIQSQLRRGTDAQVFGFYRAPQEFPGGRVSAFGIVGLGMSQKVMQDRGTISFRVNDLLSTTRFEFASSGGEAGQGYVFTGVRDPNLRQATVAFTYTFGQSNARRRPQPQQQPTQPEGGFGF